MAAGQLLMRNIQPFARDKVDLDSASNYESTSENGISDHESAETSSQQDSSDEGSRDQRSEAKTRSNLAVVSFGALQQAHESLSRKRKLDEVNNGDQEAKLAALRDRLREVKQDKHASLAAKRISARAESRVLLRNEQRERKAVANNRSDSESESDDLDQGRQSRSKHAPVEQSSKHQVTRKRQVIAVPKSTSRDPRFDALRQSSNNTANEEKAYAFLQEYQKSEIEQLKAAIKAAKSQEEKDILRRQANAMENRLNAKNARDREQEIRKKHRKQEGEQIRQGKNPYYLKRSEIKERALVEKFESMKSKDREKLMDKRRKKASQKEKKRIPGNRRSF